MEESKEIQKKAELNEEQLEQTAGGLPYLGALACCSKCGKIYYPQTRAKTITCECGNVIYRN